MDPKRIGAAGLVFRSVPSSSVSHLFTPCPPVCTPPPIHLLSPSSSILYPLFGPPPSLSLNFPLAAPPQTFPFSLTPRSTASPLLHLSPLPGSAWDLASFLLTSEPHHAPGPAHPCLLSSRIRMKGWPCPCPALPHFWQLGSGYMAEDSGPRAPRKGPLLNIQLLRAQYEGLRRKQRAQAHVVVLPKGRAGQLLGAEAGRTWLWAERVAKLRAAQGQASAGPPGGQKQGGRVRTEELVCVPAEPGGSRRGLESSMPPSLASALRF